MGLKLVNVSELPLGKRVLRYGDRGAAVKTLQHALEQTGFYCGPADGCFGLLTLEAVVSIQKAFGLKADGIAGPGLLKTLSKFGTGAGRIVYTVRPRETLAGLSQRFAVRESAWESLSGQGRPQKRIYPGMKLLLPEKLFFIWEDHAPGLTETASPSVASGVICPGWRILANGEMEAASEAGNRNGFQTVGAAAADWEAIFRQPRCWGRLAEQIRARNPAGLCFDLRDAPGGTIRRWPGFFRRCSSGAKNSKQLPLAVFRLPQESGGAPERLYWANLATIASFFRYLLFAPDVHWERAPQCEKAFEKIPLFLRKLNRMGLAYRSLLMGGAGGWLWCDTGGEEPPLPRFVPFREAHRLEAMFPRNVQYRPVSKLTSVEFLSHQGKNRLLYLSGRGWLEFAKQIARSNLAGLVIQDFLSLKNDGPAAISGAFAIMPQKMMHD